MHPYYYIRNGQGDVIGLFDVNGTIVARYTYDSWGNLLKITDGSGNDKTNDTTFVGYKNPIRYRGYYYDSETKLYYLQSRYYNPEWGRFINADAIIGANGDLVANNLFSYCSNNPIMMVDSGGFCTRCGNTHYNAANMPWSAYEQYLKNNVASIGYGFTGLSGETFTFKEHYIGKGWTVRFDKSLTGDIKEIHVHAYNKSEKIFTGYRWPSA